MKETKSLTVIIIFLIVFSVVYNLLANVLLASFDLYEMKNIFFAIHYYKIDAPNDRLVAPHFINWLLIVTIVYFSVLLMTRIHINRIIKKYKTSR